MTIESPSYAKNIYIIDFSKIHLVSCHVTNGNQCYDLYSYLSRTKKKVLFDFLDIMCVKECIVYRICLLVIGSRGQRQERPDYSNLKIV